MEPESRARDLASYSFLVVFANDDTISEAELGMIKKIALQDGKVDSEEKEVLRNIFSRAAKHDLQPHVLDEIASFRARYEI